MTIKYKNLVLEKIKESTTITDKVLYKKLTSDEYVISEGFFNQILLDLEIMGLITVSWITKDTRRIVLLSILSRIFLEIRCFSNSLPNLSFQDF